MSGGWTPGPWAVGAGEADKPYIRIRGTRLGGRYKIANVLSDSAVGNEAEANAKLIANAPDLYATGEALLAAAERHIFGDECLAERDAFRAALSRARGEQS